MQGIARTIKRRRHQNLTDYTARLGLLSSGKPRIVVRKTNKYIIGQIVKSENAQDKVEVSVSSKELLGMGWPQNMAGSLKSLAAAYLTGELLAKKTSEKEAILDIGMQRNSKNGRLYAFLRGAIDAGLNIPHNESILPNNERIESNQKTREIFIKLRGGSKHGGKGNKK